MKDKKEKSECECKPWRIVVAIVLCVIAIYLFFQGIVIQLIYGVFQYNWSAMIYYLVAVVLMALAKMAKWHGQGMCSMHNK